MKYTLFGYAAILALALASAGCSDKDTSNLAPAEADDEPRVFTDQYAPGVTYQAFLNSKTDAVQIDNSQAASGSNSLKVTVPGPSVDPPWFAGGAFTNEWVRNLTGYNVLTFYARADKIATLNTAGIANDNTGTSKYEATVSDLPLSTNWAKYVIPIPLPGKLDVEAGLFFFAEGEEDGAGYDLWFDEIRYEKLSGITDPRPSMSSQAPTTFVGATLEVNGTQTVFDVNGSDVTVSHLPGYFTFQSSNESVVKIVNGVPQVVGVGSATMSAKLGDIDVVGSVTVDPIASPPTPAPTPTVPAASVISVFSDAYNDNPVDRFTADWDEAEVVDIKITGDAVKAYAEKANAGSEFFLGIEFVSEQINATNLTHFHIDVWVPGGQYVKVKLVDFGSDGVYDGLPPVNDSEKELFYHAGTTPAFMPDTWVSLDLPLSDFKEAPGLTNTANMVQVVISTDGDVAFLDNIYFYQQQ